MTNLYQKSIKRDRKGGGGGGGGGGGYSRVDSRKF